jgi:hypothetical protein
MMGDVWMQGLSTENYMAGDKKLHLAMWDDVLRLFRGKSDTACFQASDAGFDVD